MKTFKNFAELQTFIEEESNKRVNRLLRQKKGD